MIVAASMMVLFVVRPRHCSHATIATEALMAADTLILVIPSDPKRFAYHLTTRHEKSMIATAFNPNTCQVVTEELRPACGGSAIEITSPELPGFVLFIGTDWALLVTRSKVDQSETRVIYKLRDDSCLQKCAEIAGFAYPLLSDVFW